MKRCVAATVALILLALPISPAGWPLSSYDFAATIVLRPERGARPVNRKILGSNLRWVDLGDGIMQPGSLNFDWHMYIQMLLLRPTVLRYPGGSDADVYHWGAGVGAAAQRGDVEIFFARETEKLLFGTGEFLHLAKLIGSDPMITVNVPSGSVDEAALWVGAVNRGLFGNGLGPVKYWEIGNEPYLRPPVRHELEMTPAHFAAKASMMIEAMRRMDPTIEVGIPIRADRIGTIPGTPFPGYAATVLDGVQQPINFVSTHNAYLPFIWEGAGNYSDETIFKTTMASTRVIEQDFDTIRALLARHRPGEAIRLAVTEYAAVFTEKGAIDDYIGTLGAALFGADALRVFAEADDLLMANYWSANGNGKFGAISLWKQHRPMYEVLKAFDQVLFGALVPLDVLSPRFSNRALGVVPAYDDNPLITALATVDGGMLRVVIINKDWSRNAGILLDGPRFAFSGATMRSLTDDQVFDINDADGHATGSLRWQSVDISPGALPLGFIVPAHSVSVLELRLFGN